MEPQEQTIIPSAILLSVLTTLTGSGGSYYHPTLVLYQNNVALSRRTSLADLVLADFAGYANVANVPWKAPYIDTDGSALVFSTNQTIVASGSSPANTIYGWAATDGAVTEVIFAGQFATPVGIANSGDAVTFLPAMRYSGT
jgi:hypothetical protein